jgi:hypothetical protein
MTIKQLLFPILLLFFFLTAAAKKEEKLKPEDLVAKHLHSIGPADKRAAVKSRTTSGPVRFEFKVGGKGLMIGKGTIISQGNSVRESFTFPASNYSGDQIAFDGNRVSAGQISPGNYPPFAHFIYENNLPLKEGLLFGTLSTAWALLDLPGRKPKLELSGPKKIEGRQMYELKYQSQDKNVNMSSYLYFDPETFQHVRSHFRIERPPLQISKISDSVELVRYHIVERFDDFRQDGGLTLPHSYTLEFSIDDPRGAVLTLWNYAIDRITHNDPLDNASFFVK